MKPIYQVQKNDKIPYIDPKLYSFPFDKYGISNFPIPVDNAVGTICCNNAITFVNFDDGKLNFEIKAKDFVPNNKRGDINFMPLFSKEKIGYTQTRLLRLLDLKTNNVTTHPLSGNMDEQIMNFAEIDPSKNLCMVRLSRSVGFRGKKYIIRILDFSDGTPVIKAEKIYDHIVRFRTFRNGVILYHFESKKLEILDTELKSLKHPLKDIYDNYLYNPGKNIFLCDRIQEINIHPKLPFAILTVEEREKRNQWIVSWRGGVKIFKLMESSFSYNFFSPDGKWFINVLRMYIGDKKIYKQLMMRVDENELPYYLGKPIEMKKPGVESRTGNFAWTSNPMHLTATGDGKYFKWNLSYSEIKGGDWRTVVPVKIKYKGVFGEVRK
ncbi:MAG: hypothetical protein GY714_09815 [Desulfobacterales bacterium]|nr:hypothetical protein [Desulfobacterales bacterium]